jgi:hypothetical protein
MSDLDSRGLAVDSPPKRRTAGSRFTELGDRIARSFSNLDRAKGEGPAWASVGDDDQGPVDDGIPHWEQLQPPFPVVRHGYETRAVDEYIAELEQELDELRARTPEQRVVSKEIDRIGEQTASILRVAHDKALEITREAQAQADRCVADAAANALAITEDANRRLRELDSETDAVWHERSRLVDDVRGVATALFSLAEDAAERFPGEPDKTHRGEPPRVDQPEPGATQPMPVQTEDE